MEIRNPGTSEEVLLYPLASVRIEGGAASYMHTDQLGSVRLITDAGGSAETERTYKPFGETTFESLATPAEDHGFIGERRDTDAGLIYLNARYMDPELGLFLQPDWFEVTEAGVGTNRYAYAGNDPVNKSDPVGNNPLALVIAAIGAWLGGSEPANAPDSSGETKRQSSGQTLLNMTTGAVLGLGTSVTASRAGLACIRNATCRPAAVAYGGAEATAVMVGCAEGDALSCAAMATPGVTAGSRPAPRQSELDVGASLGPDARAQVSYREGAEVPYGTKGST